MMNGMSNEMSRKPQTNQGILVNNLVGKQQKESRWRKQLKSQSKQ